MDLKIEPELEQCLPPLPEIQYQKLKASIEKKYDPAKPIVLWLERPRTIVDGHHRYRACQETGQEPTTVEESFASLEDAVLYALQRQIEQRNLTTAQLIEIQEQMMGIEERKRLDSEAKAAMLKGDNQYQSSPTDTESGGHLSREVAEQIASKANVSGREVYRVHRVQGGGCPELVALMSSGEVGAGTADLFIRAIPEKEKQKEIIESGGLGAVLMVSRGVRKAREEKNRTKREAARAERERKETEESARKFDSFNEGAKEKMAEAARSVEKAIQSANGGCLLPNVIEMWCNDCGWGFDVYLPMPSGPFCPYCKNENVTRRDQEWNPRE